MQCRKFIPALGLTCLFMASAMTARASDHLDAPALQMAGQGDRDINDLYAFESPENSANSVLIMTTNPFAGRANPLGFGAAMSGTTFGSDVTYNINIDNTGDNVADVTYATTFTAPVAGVQTYTTTLNGAFYATGTTGGAIATTTGGSKVTAGLYDDPFFFDELGFANGFMFTGDDTFAGYNTSAIVLEVPKTELNGASSNIGVWATTVVGGTQIDRVGRPAVNTALLGPTRKDAFNAGAPADDVANFGTEVNAAIAGLPGSDQANADALTPILLPDVLTYDTSDSGGFLNGRKLDDDVIDAELNLLTQGAATGDGVAFPTNQVASLAAFPYLAPANAIPEPSSIALLACGLAAIGGGRRRRRSRE